MLSSWVTSRNIWTTNQPSSTVWVDPTLEKRPGEWQNIAKVNDIVLDDSGEHVVGCMTTAGSIIFLIDAKRQLAVFKLFDAVYQGDYALASLIASVITVIVLLVEGLAFLITRKGENRRVSRT